MFDNGANSDEGRAAGIQVAKDGDDLDQRLDQRPSVIQDIVNDIILFDSQLKEKRIVLKDSSIKRIDEYRAVNESNGIVVRNFVLVTEQVEGLPPQVAGRIVYRGRTPVLLKLRWDSSDIEVSRHLNQEEKAAVAREQQMAIARKHTLETELKFLLGD